MLNTVSEQVTALAAGDVTHDSFTSLRGTDVSDSVLAASVQGLLQSQTEITAAVDDICAPFPYRESCQVVHRAPTKRSDLNVRT